MDSVRLYPQSSNTINDGITRQTFTLNLTCTSNPMQFSFSNTFKNIESVEIKRARVFRCEHTFESYRNVPFILLAENWHTHISQDIMKKEMFKTKCGIDPDLLYTLLQNNTTSTFIPVSLDMCVDYTSFDFIPGLNFNTGDPEKILFSIIQNVMQLDNPVFFKTLPVQTNAIYGFFPFIINTSNFTVDGLVHFLNFLKMMLWFIHTLTTSISSTIFSEDAAKSILSNLPSEAIATILMSLPTSVITGLFSTLPSNIIEMIPTEIINALLTNPSVTILSNIINMIPSSLLVSFITGLPNTVLMNIMMNLPNDILSSIGSQLGSINSINFPQLNFSYDTSMERFYITSQDPFCIIPGNAHEVYGFRGDGIYIGKFDTLTKLYIVYADFEPKLNGPDIVHITSDEITSSNLNTEYESLLSLFLQDTEGYIEREELIYRKIQNISFLPKLTLRLLSDIKSGQLYKNNGKKWYVELILQGTI
jgi:hypothetical protein